MNIFLWHQIVDVNIALLFARVVIAVVFLYFGLPKVKNLAKNSRDFDDMGLKPGWLWGTLAAVLEVGGALVILSGRYVTTIALLYAIYMVFGLAYKITKTRKKFPDWSYDLILLALSLLLAAIGGGIYGL